MSRKFAFAIFLLFSSLSALPALATDTPQTTLLAENDSNGTQTVTQEKAPESGDNNEKKAEKKKDGDKEPNCEN